MNAAARFAIVSLMVAGLTATLALTPEAAGAQTTAPPPPPSSVGPARAPAAATARD